MAILVTGGAGFIGSHTCVELLNAGEDIVVMDNFYNSNSRALDGIRKITGKDFKFYEDDMLDIAAVDQIFAENDIEQVIHFAGYKCVPESVQKPLMYYSNNLRGDSGANPCSTGNDYRAGGKLRKRSIAPCQC